MSRHPQGNFFRSMLTEISSLLEFYLRILFQKKLNCIDYFRVRDIRNILMKTYILDVFSYEIYIDFVFFPFSI